jgi:hypothetical protein
MQKRRGLRIYIHGHDGGEGRIRGGNEKKLPGISERKESTIQNCGLTTDAFKRKRIKNRA